ncbi:hypothetical protein FOZ60_001446 [Perkinsus olseni]|uniref:Uncharacterized protein n=1 Tax=Perkinsus olseni TaxID=32597 RepID=A0A7J6PLE2_PEROL|nr:hypothetical protein FOZ60_001446 [Perkinsus olseni]
MRYHRHAASLSLTIILALQTTFIRGQHEPVVVGESENGTRVQTTGLKNVKDLISKDRMYVTENADKPAPNAMYFGFNEEGLQATVQFDETSQVRKVRVNAESCETFEYTMLGKAIVGFFYSSKPKAQFGVILEPVDPEKFDGSKESFSRARINTIVGWHGKAEEVYEALSLNSFEPLKSTRSRISRIFKTIRHAASTFPQE